MSKEDPESFREFEEYMQSLESERQNLANEQQILLHDIKQFTNSLEGLEEGKKEQVLQAYGVISQLPKGIPIRMWRVRTIIILVAIGMIIGFACGVSLGIRIKP